MPAFLICDVKMKDREKLIEYLELAKGTVEKYGGKYLAQAGETLVIEGDWTPQTVIVVEFPTMEAAKDWYVSDEYAPALKMNPQAMMRNMVLMQGL